MMSKSVKRVLMALALILTVWHLYSWYGDIPGDLEVLRGMSYPDHINRLAPGLAETVAWLQQNPDNTVHILRHEQNALLHQRLTEMLYPRPSFPLGKAGLVTGDLVVVEASSSFKRFGRTVFARGDLRILVVP